MKEMEEMEEMKEMRKRGNAEMRKRGNAEMRKCGNAEMRVRGKKTRKTIQYFWILLNNEWIVWRFLVQIFAQIPVY